MKFSIQELANTLKNFFVDKVKNLTADTLGWLAAIVFHLATIPQLLAIISGLTDKTPDLEIVLFIWAGLSLLWARAILLQNRLNIITIGSGFIVQAVLMALIMFR
jgi:uncharacterized protein with PQ loop repeat